jgi:hypothetical protein
LANCCTSEATVEFKNPHFTPHTSATALANFSWVESASSTILNKVTLTTSFSGTTVDTDFQLSETDDRLPSKEVVEVNGKEIGTAESGRVDGGLLRR